MAKKPKVKANSDEISRTYIKLKPKYENLGINLTQAIKQFLNENDIKVLSVDHRVKDETSLLEKIERKEYENPLEEIEDLCGIRIICYYQSDVIKIGKIISKEFEVLENQDKEELLGADQFGYRSTHFIVKIKKTWLNAPNYRNLEDFKAEIQIRTVLMHAWAEIEHKLSYKKDTHIPKQFHRTFSRLSAKLEEADEQFEELKNKITQYKKDVVEITQGKAIANKDVELNLDSLQAFLDATFPVYEKDLPTSITQLLDELLSQGIGLHEVHLAFEIVKDYLPKVNIDFGGRLSRVGAVRTVLELTNDSYRQGRTTSTAWRSVIEKWIQIISQESS